MNLYEVKISLSGIYESSSTRVAHSRSAADRAGRRDPIPELEIGGGFEHYDSVYSPGTWEPKGVFDLVAAGCALVAEVKTSAIIEMTADDETALYWAVQDHVANLEVFPVDVPGWNFVMPLLSFEIVDEHVVDETADFVLR